MGLVKVVGHVVEAHPKLFNGLGKLDNEYSISLKADCTPYSLSTPRGIPVPYLKKVKGELKRMEHLGVISKVEKPTDWCAGMVVVPKPRGKIRICTDYTKLNEARSRRYLPLSSRPFGRFRYHRLPFGISSAPEIFQRRMSMILEGLDGVICQMDDTLVFGANHARLKAVLECLEKVCLTLNKEKCEFSQTTVTFLGHVIDENGIRPDPDRIQAVVDMKSPGNISELRRFLGMVNQLGKFSSKIADLTKPMRDLLSSKNEWIWGIQQEQAFNNVKSELSSAPILALYDPSGDTKLSAGTSSYGLGAVLLQKQRNSEWRAVAFASRSMTETEQRYVQVEKEALATTWACEKFSNYITGLSFEIETDLKPLVAFLGYKSLNELPPRIQRFRMRLMNYTYNISYTPGTGSSIRIADTLSRAPLPTKADKKVQELQEEVRAHVSQVIAQLPATSGRLSQIQDQQQKDPTCSEIISYRLHGWPDRRTLSKSANLFWPMASELTVQQGLLMRNSRLVIPMALRREILSQIHEGHQGIVKCRRRASESVWWPGMSKDIGDLVKDCLHCAKHRTDKAEPMVSSVTPERPWKEVGTDLFYLNGNNDVLVVDYFSRYIEISKLMGTTSHIVVDHLKSIFARHGIPEIVRSDNGPQYCSDVFRQFSAEYEFEHVTSSPRYAQSNGEAERAVQTVKRLLDESKDQYLTLLSYRTTPLETGQCPAELLMGRKLRSTLVTHPSLYKPRWRSDTFRKRDTSGKQIQKINYDKRHRAHAQQEPKPGDNVWVKGTNVPGDVKSNHPTPRSYIVKTRQGEIRTNRRFLVKTHSPITIEPMESAHDEESPTTDYGSHELPRDDTFDYPAVIRTRSGRISKTPNRLYL
ncbi:uncharacterized protein K02A2.6-like [Ylistrum balloti]|uniref:uncharacterized protein K02A2.6-like n=1 Tax=Ylistrum balloti TaxID=509963 RepID=UPI002905D858|nr:uncharacterized protein K02A2.6-like [Ylistrum balloti]